MRSTVDLSYAQVNGDLKLSGSTQSHYILRSASVRGLVFDKKWVDSAVERKGAKISLAGTSYGRLEVEEEKEEEEEEEEKKKEKKEKEKDTRRRKLVRALVQSLGRDVDIATRRKLVAVLNRQGLEDSARDAERILRRGARHRLSRFERVTDFIYGWGFDYGISPWITLVAPLCLFFLGFFAYSRPNAVVWKTDMEEKEAVELRCKPSERGGDVECSTRNMVRKTTIGLAKAAGVSLRYALPGEIALGGDYEASDERLVAWLPVLTSEGYATVQRVVGWITIPLMVAACAGLIWRRPGGEEAEAELE
jgi:hypothetical protein